MIGPHQLAPTGCAPTTDEIVPGLRPGRTRVCDACQTRSQICCMRVGGSANLGFSMQSTAPSDSASITSRLPFSVSAETITTGIGRCFMSRATKSSPDMPGIST
jgi:hypothetical protein